MKPASLLGDTRILLQSNCQLHLQQTACKKCNITMYRDGLSKRQKNKAKTV